MHVNRRTVAAVLKIMVSTSSSGTIGDAGGDAGGRPGGWLGGGDDGGLVVTGTCFVPCENTIRSRDTCAQGSAAWLTA